MSQLMHAGQSWSSVAMDPMEPAVTVNSPPPSFDAVFDRYARPIMAFIYSLVGDRTLAEDLAQDTFVRSFQTMHRKREETSLSTWLFGVAHFVALEALRRRKYRRIELPVEDPEVLGLAAAEPHAEQSALSREAVAIIGDALMSLPADFRSVFVLKIMLQLRYEEIAEATGRSISKLKTDLHRARQEMRKRLSPLVSPRERCGKQ